VTAADGGAILVYDASLSGADTVRLADGFLDRGAVGAWLAPDGTTLYAARRTPTAGALVRARVADGVILDRVDFFDGAPAIVSALYDGRTVLAATVSRSGPAPRTLVHFLIRDLSAQTEPVPACDAAIRGLATTRGSERIYALCDGDTLAELDRGLRTLVRTTSVDGPGETSGARCDATDVAVSSNGSIVFVLCAAAGTIRYLDRLTLQPLDSLAVGSGGRRWARSPDGQYAVVLRPDEHEIVVADLRRRAVTGRPTVPFAPGTVVVGSDSRVAYVTAGDGTGEGVIVEIALASGTVVREHGTVPRAVALSAWPGDESPVMHWGPERP
jgi:DNA-binding beta-propeller fold protein YncE